MEPSAWIKQLSDKNCLAEASLIFFIRSRSVGPSLTQMALTNAHF